MVIAIDARLWKTNVDTALSVFTNEVFCKLPFDNKDSVLLIMDKPLLKDLQLPKPFQLITLQPSPKTYVTYMWWYKIRLPMILKKYKVDVFIGTYGFLSSKCTAKQIMIIHDLSFFHKHTNNKSWGLLFQKKNFVENIKSASLVLTVTEALKTELENNYSAIANRLAVCLSNAKENIQPLQWEEKQLTKNNVTMGAEYFIMEYSADTFSEFIVALKSFSIFKKWQKTNMKLVVMCKGLQMNKEHTDKLKSFKYKNDVILHDSLNAQHRNAVLGAAYAYIHLIKVEGFAYNILRAMKCAVPVITYDAASAREMLGDCGFYVTASNETSLSEQLKTIYKNENARTNAIHLGQQKAANYSWEKTRSVIYNSIIQVMQE